jgi:hypothetical protein
MTPCEQYDREALENLAFKLAAMSKTVENNPDLIMLQCQVLGKLAILGGGPVETMGSEDAPDGAEALLAALREGEGNERLCAHTRNFFRASLLRAERILSASEAAASNVRRLNEVRAF